MFTFSSQRSKVAGLFCSIYPGRNKIFVDAAMKLGELLAKEKIQVVYGGGSLGLMGTAATVAAAGGSQVTGIMPKFLSNYCGPTSGKLVQVETISEQITAIYNSANAFIVLPGGQDTLEGFSCILSWSFASLHRKPIFLLNINGYYDSLLMFLDNAVRNGFLYSTARVTVITASTVEELVQKFLTYDVFPGTEILQLPHSRKRNREFDSNGVDLTLSL